MYVAVLPLNAFNFGITPRYAWTIWISAIVLYEACTRVRFGGSEDKILILFWIYYAIKEYSFREFEIFVHVMALPLDTI